MTADYGCASSALPLQSKPKRPHLRQKRFGYFKTRTVSDDAINSTRGTKRGLFIADPLVDPIWAEYFKAIEATAMFAAFNFRAVAATLLVREAKRMIFGEVKSAGHASRQACRAD